MADKVDRIIAELEVEIEAIRPTLEERRAEVAALEQEIRRMERALKVLKGEPLGNPQGSAGTRGPYKTRTNVPKVDKSGKRRNVSEEKVQQTQAIIMRLATETDEFRQVDVRSLTPTLNSSTAALAFEVLRQRGVIRLARQEGLNKWYRLTRAIANKNGNDEEMSDAPST